MTVLFYSLLCTKKYVVCFVHKCYHIGAMYEIAPSLTFCYGNARVGIMYY